MTAGSPLISDMFLMDIPPLSVRVIILLPFTSNLTLQSNPSRRYSFHFSPAVEIIRFVDQQIYVTVGIAAKSARRTVVEKTMNDLSLNGMEGS